MASCYTAKSNYERQYDRVKTKEDEINISSRLEVFLAIGYLKICSKFTGEHSCQSVISIKLLRCSENMQQIYRRPSMPKCDFNEVALQFY